MYQKIDYMLSDIILRLTITIDLFVVHAMGVITKYDENRIYHKISSNFENIHS